MPEVSISPKEAGQLAYGGLDGIILDAAEEGRSCRGEREAERMEVADGGIHEVSDRICADKR